MYVLVRTLSGNELAWLQVSLNKRESISHDCCTWPHDPTYVDIAGVDVVPPAATVALDWLQHHSVVIICECIISMVLGSITFTCGSSIIIHDIPTWTDGGISIVQLVLLSLSNGSRPLAATVQCLYNREGGHRVKLMAQIVMICHTISPSGAYSATYSCVDMTYYNCISIQCHIRVTTHLYIEYMYLPQTLPGILTCDPHTSCACAAQTLPQALVW